MNINNIRIPDLEFDSLGIQLDRSDLEVNTDGTDVALGVCVIRKSKQQTGFSDSGLSNQKELEQVIAKDNLRNGDVLAYYSGFILNENENYDEQEYGGI